MQQINQMHKKVHKVLIQKMKVITVSFRIKKILKKRNKCEERSSKTFKNLAKI